MKEQDIRQALITVFTQDDITIDLQGNSASITVISAAFANQTTVKRQQMVYGAITKLIQDGRLHAVSIQAYTPDEARNKF